MSDVLAQTTVELPVRGPAAVLMVNLSERRVVHVNSVAEELAPGVSLPVDVDAWSDRAELRDPEGRELSDTDHPLSRVVRSEPVDGQAVSAARHSALGERREPLWVVAVPMVGAPSLDEHALVVLIPVADHRATGGFEGPRDLDESELDDLTEMVREHDGAAMATEVAYAGLPAHEDDAQRSLRDRALAATSLSFTVADALDPDQPLVWVNPAFTATTGYEFDEAVGRNCRFLQGPDTIPADRHRLRDAIDRGVSTSVVLLNYRKDGSSFWNQVDLSPVHDSRGAIAHVVGIQTDVTARVEAEQVTRRALDSERAARADAEAARTRLSFLIDAVNRLTATLDLEQCASELLGLVVPFLADWAVLMHQDETGALSRVSTRHRDPSRALELEGLAAALPGGLRTGALADTLLEGRSFRVLSELASDSARREAAGYLDDLSMRDLTEALDGEEALVVALTGRGGVRDVLALVRTAARPAYDEADVTTAIDLGRRAGLIFDNAAMYDAQARIAEVLQRSLLPELPPIAGVETAVRYLAAASSAQVGGDFYEVFDFAAAGDEVDHRPHRFGFVVGDVMGHDILAAAAMGHLKGILRAAAHDLAADPARVLEHVEHLMATIGMPTLSTALFVVAEPVADAWRLRWSSAGHLPLVLLHPDGSVETLDLTHNDTILGLGGVNRTQHELTVPVGTVVVACTDGLVERRGEPVDEGLARLHAVVGELDPDGDLDQACDRVIARLAPPADRDDDVALLLLRLGS